MTFKRISTQVAGLDDFGLLRKRRTRTRWLSTRQGRDDSQRQFKFEQGIEKIKDWLFLDKPVVNDYIYDEI